MVALSAILYFVNHHPGLATLALSGVVIMCDESHYGKRRKIERDRAPVEKAAGQYAVNPANQAFIRKYRAALQVFLRKHRDDADPDLIEEYEQDLNTLGQN